MEKNEDAELCVEHVLWALAVKPVLAENKPRDQKKKTFVKRLYYCTRS